MRVYIEILFKNISKSKSILVDFETNIKHKILLLENLSKILKIASMVSVQLVVVEMSYQ